jgi:uncharacterized protein
MIFIDTNIFLRHLTQDDPQKAIACLKLFTQIEEGNVVAWTTDLAIAEVVFVLSSKRANNYGYSRQQVSQVLLPLLSLKNLHIPAKGLYPRIFEIYIEQNVDFIDAYHAALVEISKRTELYSYDQDFDSMPGIKRIEP